MSFPSTDSGGNPFEPLFNRSYFLSDQNPSSEHAHNPPFLSSSSSPFFDESKLPLNQMLSQNQLVARKNLDTSDQTKNNHVGDSTKSNEKEIDRKAGVGPLRRRNLGVIPRRRPGKKDRHSKICTAHGIRDRRMRLSLQVARKFFDLQDMLGFDKASKTIEWLFTNSKKAIKELKQTISDRKISESFLSDCEVASDIEDSSRNHARQSSTPADAMTLCIKQSETKFNQENACKSNTRESRDRARARARSRTREKMMIKWVEDLGPGYKPNPGDYYLETLGFPNSPSGGVDHGLSSQKRVSPYEHVYQPIEHQLPDMDTIEKLLGSSSSSVSSSWPISNYNSSEAAASGLYIDPNFSFLGFLGNWDQVSVQGNNPNSIYSSNPDFQ